MIAFNVLQGKTVNHIAGLEIGSDEAIFSCADGTQYRLYHQQDCCETVEVEDIEGDVSDLLNNPLTTAEIIDDKTIDLLKLVNGVKAERDISDSGTWTYYRMATAKGMVVIRWLGESNGYYSEEVYFEEIKP